MTSQIKDKNIDQIALNGYVPKICSVTLTFNDLSNLQNSVVAIQSQTRKPDTILVIDNHSSDGTQEYLEALRLQVPQLKFVRTSANLGPAGGFSLGMTWAFDQGYDYIWLLDDDSIPAPNCLEILYQELGARTDTIIWPLNIDETGRESWYPSWRGELLSRQIIERGGVPNKDLFWGVEDTEYFIGRLRQKHDIQSIYTRQAVVHFTQSNPRKNSTWHYYYRPRNMVYYRLWVQHPRKYRKLITNLTKLWLKAMLREDHKLKKSRYMLLGIGHGLRRQLGKTIDPAVAT